MLPPVQKIGLEARRVAKDSMDNLSKLINSVNILKQNTQPEQFQLVQDNLNVTRGILKDLQNTVSGYSELMQMLTKIHTSFGDIFRYIKNYQGELTRNDQPIHNYRFYDEREWRYIPALTEKKIDFSLSEKEYLEFRNASAVKPFVENFSLPFTSRDIKYLIVKSEQDISSIIETIRHAENLTSSPNDGDILNSKILTVEQIETDF